MSNQGPTCLSQEHQEHLCQLKLKGEDITQLTDVPTHECGICWAKANCPESLCDPYPLVK